MKVINCKSRKKKKKKNFFNGFFLFFFFNEKNSKIDLLQKEISQATQEISKLRKMEAQIPHLEKELQIARDDVKEFQKMRDNAEGNAGYAKER